MSPAQHVISRCALPCPACGGPVYREFSFFTIIGFFLPVHLISKARYQCLSCATIFKAYANYSDYVLAASFTGVTWLLADYWIFSAIMLAAWLAIAFCFRRKMPVIGPGHTLIAGVLLATLSFAALLVHSDAFGGWIQTCGDILYGMASLIGVEFGILLQYLDRLAHPRLHRA